MKLVVLMKLRASSVVDIEYLFVALLQQVQNRWEWYRPFLCCHYGCIFYLNSVALTNSPICYVYSWGRGVVMKRGLFFALEQHKENRLVYKIMSWCADPTDVFCSVPVVIKWCKGEETSSAPGDWTLLYKFVNKTLLLEFLTFPVYLHWDGKLSSLLVAFSLKTIPVAFTVE